MNIYRINFYGIDSYVEAETAAKAKYTKWRELQNADFDVTFEYFLCASTCHKAGKAIPKTETSSNEVFSYKDSCGKLCVDCSECERGGNGDKSCSCGWQKTKGGHGGCFLGKLIEQTKGINHETK